MVLSDDNFASIVAAIREGRTVYNNLKKVISWTLPTSIGESMTIIAALLLGLTLPITPVQILWINLITASTLGIVLAFEPSDANTMKVPPRHPDEPILSKELAWYIVLVSCLFLGGVFSLYQYAIQSGYSIELARTMVVNTLVIMEIFQLFFIRSFYSTSFSWQNLRGTPLIWFIIAIVIIAQFAITYLPALQAIFSTRSPSITDLLLIFLVGLATYIIAETEKYIRIKFFSKRRILNTKSTV